jgi:hypothetical protein
MKSSFHSLTPFLLLFCSCQFRRLDSIKFLISRQAGVPNLHSLLPTSVLCCLTLFITTLHGPRRKHNLSTVDKAYLQRRCIATEVTALLLEYLLPHGMCLGGRWLEMNVYSDFTIPAFGRHVTILLNMHAIGNCSRRSWRLQCGLKRRYYSVALRGPFRNSNSDNKIASLRVCDISWC